MIVPIYVYGQRVLRKRAQDVTAVTPELTKLAEDMLETMYQSNGIGLAAPQVGRSIRLIVADVSMDEEKREPRVFFNPVITVRRGSCLAEEGCLSVPGIWADVERAETVTVEALDKTGKLKVMKNLSGMLARCIQHEIDHLDGVLFVDKISATDLLFNKNKLKEIPQEAKSVPA